MKTSAIVIMFVSASTLVPAPVLAQADSKLGPSSYRRLLQEVSKRPTIAPQQPGPSSDDAANQLCDREAPAVGRPDGRSERPPEVETSPTL